MLLKDLETDFFRDFAATTKNTCKFEPCGKNPNSWKHTGFLGHFLLIFMTDLAISSGGEVVFAFHPIPG